MQPRVYLFVCLYSLIVWEGKKERENAKIKKKKNLPRHVRNDNKDRPLDVPAFPPPYPSPFPYSVASSPSHPTSLTPRRPRVGCKNARKNLLLKTLVTPILTASWFECPGSRTPLVDGRLGVVPFGGPSGRSGQRCRKKRRSNVCGFTPVRSNSDLSVRVVIASSSSLNVHSIIFHLLLADSSSYPLALHLAVFVPYATL